MKPKADIVKQCGLCEIGRPAPDGKSVLCIRKGVMPLDARCGKFRYDPLKRVPPRPVSLATERLSQEDFSI